jgi:hypothetical protein
MRCVDAVKLVERTGDAKMAGAIADSLRRVGYRYADVLAFVQRHSSITAEQWEQLQYEADALASGEGGGRG